MKKNIVLIIAIFISFTACQKNILETEQIENEVEIESTVTDIVDEETDLELAEKEVNTSKENEVLSNPMAIETLRQRNFEGSEFLIEEKLANGTNYEQYIVSYLSEGLKIYGLLTVPLEEKPESGFPSILFIHGYIPPEIYSTTGNYPTYQARLARAGFVTFKPDLRGHGNSQGEPVSAHYSEKYVVDTLFALESLKKYPEVDPERIGYWGHSNGGQIGLRVVTITEDIKAASLWAGVVGSYVDMFETYNPQIDFLSEAQESKMVVNNGLPSENSDFWQQVDPFFYLNDITAAIQIQHGTLDDSVPIELSESLRDSLLEIGKELEYYEYPGADHNIAQNVNEAFQRAIEFYRANL